MNKLVYLLLLSACLFGIVPANADTQTIRFSTTYPIGQELTFQVASWGVVTVDWGDGVPVDYVSEQITGTIKGNELVVTSDEFFTSFTCDSAEIETLDLTGAPALKMLSCKGNKLTQLNLTKNTELNDLDCSNNALTALKLTANTQLLALDCSNNQLTTLDVSKCTALRTLICSNNALKSVSTTSNKELLAFWCDNNQFYRLSLNDNTQLQSVVATHNKVALLSVQKLTDLRDFWIGYNKLTSLNLSAVTNLQTLSCDSNQIKSVTIGNLNGSNPLYYADFQNNNLNVSQIYPVTYIKNYLFGNQDTVRLSFDTVNKGEYVDFGAYLTNQADTRVGQISFYNADDNTELTRGLSADYYYLNGRAKFNKFFKNIYAKITVNKLDANLRTSNFAVVDPTGIESVETASGLQITAQSGKLSMVASSNTTVAIYSIDGKAIWNGIVGPQGCSLSLAKGIYLVNNKKISIQ